MNEESVIWRGSSSQLTNFWWFLIGILVTGGTVVGGLFFPPAFALAAVPLLAMLWQWLVVRCRVFELTAERLRMYEGVLNRRIDEIELYRVKDTAIDQPFWLRIFGLGNLTLQTSDRSHPIFQIPAIANVMDLREKLRGRVEELRDRKRVREVDFDETGDDGDWHE